MQTHLDGMQARAGALTELWGAAELTERIQRRQATIGAVEAGLLRREMFAARLGG